jgi:hypothetical protein
MNFPGWIGEKFMAFATARGITFLAVQKMSLSAEHQ